VKVSLRAWARLLRDARARGWGANFYTPSYVGIGRALAKRGFATISVNTRMHDIGNVEKYTLLEKRVRGGGYWGVTSEDGRDIPAYAIIRPVPGGTNPADTRISAGASGRWRVIR